MPLKDDLSQVFRGEILDDQETLTTFSKDASIFELTPQLVLAPSNSQDIKALVSFINSHPELNLSITPRSAGTCMSGGAIGENLVLDMTKHFNQILEVGDGFVKTQPGVYYRDFEPKTLEKGWLLPCYTSSREICTVGGMVGNNSAGEKSLAWGQTKDYVKSLKVILADGYEYNITSLSKDQLEDKMNQENFEGNMYRKVYEIVEENYDLIKAAKPTTSKNSAGYLLWEIWDRETFDLTKLFVGSQGTLGIVTEVEFKLVKPPAFSSLLIIDLHDLNNLDHIVNTVLKYQPESFECYDDQTIKFAVRFVLEIIKEFKQNHQLQALLQFLPEIFMFLTNSLPKLVLLASFTGSSQAEAIHKCLTAQTALEPFNLKSKIRTDELMEKNWIIRRNSFNLLRHHAKHKRTAPFIDDIIVKPEYLPNFLPRLKQIMEKYKKYLIYTVAGHIGNGNFHIIPLMDFSDPNIKAVIPQISREVFDLIKEFKGSIAAEHNDGLVRGPYLEEVFGEDVYQLFKEVKYLLDPKNIFNPHKKVDATFEYSLAHLAKS